MSIFVKIIIKYLNIFVVAEPPDKPRIMSESSHATVRQGILEVAGENRNLTLVCLVTGGAPPPSLTWWKDDVLLDTSFER